MATTMPGYYTTTMVPQGLQHRLVPQIHQYTQAVGPHYQQQSVQQYPQEPQIFERIVNVTRRPTIEETLQLPVRQFVSFKNLRRLNKPGQQWEYCEHVKISLQPEDLEKKVRAHDEDGNDLVDRFVSMGSNRQKHVRRFEEKLNQKEVDPTNWKWDLQALGEVREKQKATPQSFWAIFQRNATKKNLTTQSQLRGPPVVAIHQPISYSQQSLQLQQSAYSHQQPQVIEVPTVTAPPPPQPMQRPPLALPAPPLRAPAAQAPTASSNTAYASQPAQPQPAPAHQYRSEQRQSSQTKSQPRTQPQVQQRVLPTMSNGPQHSARQLTNQSQGSTRTPYVRPLPGTLQQPPSNGLVRNQRQTPEVDVYKYQERDQSPPRWPTAVSHGQSRGRFVEEDSLSEDSSSSYGGSSSGTSITNYTLSSARPPLGKTSSSDRKHRSPSSHRQSSQHSSPVTTASSRPSHEQDRRPRLSSRRSSSPPRSTRRSKVEIDFQLGTSHGRQNKDRHYHSTPRSFARQEDHESADEEFVRRPQPHHVAPPRAPMPGAFDSAHRTSQHSQHVSYVPAERVPRRRF